MAPPTSAEVFGDLRPIPPKDLLDDDKIYAALNTPGSPFELEQRLIHGRLQTVYKDLPNSMRDFWMSCAKTYAKRDYIVYEDQRFSYHDIWLRSVRAAHWLQREFQVRKGDRVGISSRNYPEFIVAFWATCLIGGVATILNSFHDGDTLAFSVQDVSCRVVICDGERYERLAPYVERMGEHKDAEAETSHINAQSVTRSPFVGLIVMPWHGTRATRNESDKPWLKHKSPLVRDWQTIDERAVKEYGTLEEPPQVQVFPDENGCILFTSGTTGRPKGVLSTQRQHLSCLRLTTFGSARALLRRKRPIPPPPDPSSMEQTSGLILVPLAHTTGLQSGVVGSTATGNKIVLMAGYKRDLAIQLAQREDVRAILGIGFMVREIVLSGAKLPNLQVVAHGGSSSAKELPDETAKHHPNAILSAGYGLTEVNGVAAAIVLDDYHARPTSAGKPPLGVELKIVDPQTGSAVKNGQRGELWIRTPGRALGYWNRPKESAEAFLADGWFRSGDLAVMDDQGFLFIVDRVKDIIVRGGENISCTHVESAAYAHPSIIECAAVAIPDKRLGERVGLVCVVKDNVKQLPGEGEVAEVLQKALPKYAVPEYFWIRRDELPHNPNGKVLRNEVKKQVLDRIKEQDWSGKDTGSAGGGGKREAKL